MQRENLSLVIKSTLRRRIITHTGSDNLVIYEGKLAQEFQVSRTPVRQVIQSLAAERMVEVRSGVGTIATPLLPERKLQDMRSFSAILKACSECTTDDSANLVLIEISSLRIYLEQLPTDLSSEAFFDISNKFVSSLAQIVGDAILLDALIACYWRFIRRRLAEHKGDIAAAKTELAKLVEGAEYGAKEGDAERILRMISVGVEDLINA